MHLAHSCTRPHHGLSNKIQPHANYFSLVWCGGYFQIKPTAESLTDTSPDQQIISIIQEDIFCYAFHIQVRSNNKDLL